MDLEANIDIDANLDLNVVVDANLDVDAELNANVADVELEIDAPEVNFDAEAELNIPEVNAEVEGELSLPVILAPECELPETMIVVNVGSDAGQQDIEVGGEVSTQNNKKKQEKVSLFTKKEFHGFEAAFDGLLTDSAKKEKVRDFILTCNSLQMLQALINIGLTIFFTTLSELYLADYMARAGHASILGGIQKWMTFNKAWIKFCLFISIMFAFTKCARNSKGGGVVLFISSTFWGIMLNMCDTVFPTKNSAFHVLSFYLQFLATLIGIRRYIANEKLDDYDSKKAAISAGIPLIAMSMILSLLDSEYSIDLIMPNVLLFIWGVSASFTNFLCLEGKKKYVEIKNTCFGSQIMYVDASINIYQVMLLYFSSKDDEVKDIENDMGEALDSQDHEYAG